MKTYKRDQVLHMYARTHVYKPANVCKYASIYTCLHAHTHKRTRAHTHTSRALKLPDQNLFIYLLEIA